MGLLALLVACLTLPPPSTNTAVMPVDISGPSSPAMSCLTQLMPWKSQPKPFLICGQHLSLAGLPSFFFWALLLGHWWCNLKFPGCLANELCCKAEEGLWDLAMTGDTWIGCSLGGAGSVSIAGVMCDLVLFWLRCLKQDAFLSPLNSIPCSIRWSLMLHLNSLKMFSLSYLHQL